MPDPINITDFAIGMIVDWDGQAYKLVGIDPYLNRKGEETDLLTWQSHCRACGAVFTVTTGALGKFKGPNRRCPKHHWPGRSSRNKAKVRWQAKFPWQES